MTMHPPAAARAHEAAVPYRHPRNLLAVAVRFRQMPLNTTKKNFMHQLKEWNKMNGRKGRKEGRKEGREG